MMHVYKLLKALPAANLESVSGKHQGRRKAYEYRQLLNRSCATMKCRRVGRVGEEKEERNHTNIKCLLLSDPSSLVVACGYKVRHPYCGIERVNLLCSLVQGQGYNPEESFLNILLINIFNPAWLTLCNCSGCY